MAVPTLIMQKPFILVLAQQGSVLSGSANGTGLNFGVVQLIYDTCDNFEVGDMVTYFTAGQSLVVYDSVEYAMIEEKSIINREVPIP